MINFIKKLLGLEDKGYRHVIKLNGRQGWVFNIKDKDALTKIITICGFNIDHWGYKKGQKISLVNADNKEYGCYKIISVEHCGDPADMYFIDIEYPKR